MGILTQSDRDLIATWAERERLSLVVLFGSQARAGKGRDLDLAVSPLGPSHPHALTVSLSRVLSRGDLDLAWLPTAGWLLHAQVARDGLPLYEDRPGRFAEFSRVAAVRQADAGIWRRRDKEFILRSLNGDLTVDSELVRHKLARLLQYLAELQPVLDHSATEFVAQPLLHHAGERLAELLVECAASINTEVARGVAGIPASDYYSSFLSMARTGWVDPEVARRLAEVTSLRNVLVHQDEEVELEPLYHKVKDSLPDWRAYAEGVARELD